MSRVDIDLAEYDVSVDSSNEDGLGVTATHSMLSPYYTRTTRKYGFENGTNGQEIVVGDHDVIYTQGTPTYRGQSNCHGGYGCYLTPTNLPKPSDLISYPLLNPFSFSISFYVRVISNAEPATQPHTVMQIQSASRNSVVQLKVTKGGKFTLEVGPDAVAKSQATTTFGSTVDDWTRLDLSGEYSSETGVTYVRLGIALQHEASVYSEILSYAIAGSAQPAFVDFIAQGVLTLDIDTIRIANTAEKLLGPYAPDLTLPTPLVVFTGGATPSGVIVKSCYSVADKNLAVDLAVSTSPTMSSPIRPGAATITTDTIATHTVSGLAANTRYYAQRVQPVTLKPFGDQFSFKTAPPTTGSWTLKAAVYSCQSNDDNWPFCWQDILDWGADTIWNLGDYAYIGQNISAEQPYFKDIDKRVKAHVTNTIMRAAIQSAPLGVTMVSDHELHTNGPQFTGGDPIDTFGCLHSIREIEAFKRIQPVRTFLDTRSPMRHRGYTYDVGSKMRVIVTDFRSPERSMETDPDGPNKQMWGAYQEAQIFAALDATKLNVLAGESSWWMHAGKGGAPDKYYTYPTAQQRLADKINGTGAYAGGPVYKALWVGGDRHYCGYFNAAATAGLHIPQIISSGISKTGLALQPDEVPTWQWGAGFRTAQIVTRVPNKDAGHTYASSFTLTYAGQTTAAIAGDATAAQVQSALIALSNIGPSDVRVYGGGFTDGTPLPYEVRFGGALNANTSLLSAAGVGGDVIADKGESPVCMYTQIVFAYNAGNGQISVSSQARGVVDTSGPDSSWVVSNLPGGTSLDVWTP